MTPTSRPSLPVGPDTYVVSRLTPLKAGGVEARLLNITGKRPDLAISNDSGDHRYLSGVWPLVVGEHLEMPPQLKVGDLVEPINSNLNHLYSGANHYHNAVVARVDPFMLVSTQGDMVWSSTIQAKDFKLVGSVEGRLAPPQSMANVIERLGRALNARI